jgi:steroid 5-alpha reductase family enzyme
MNEVFAALAALLVCTTSLWLLSLRLRDASIIDLFWGPGFVVAGAAYAFGTAGDALRRFAVLALVAIWALRLAVHLARRNLGHGEDKRYVAMRAAGGRRWPLRSLFQVFWLQAGILWIVSLPIHGALVGAAPLGPLDAAGVALWAAGFAFEAIGDAQLARFKADPSNAGRVLRRGLWAHTRHPNYFGEALMGWGIWLCAASAGAWWTVFAPALMTFLLLRVSGVALLERTLAAEKPDYAAYVREVPAFFPKWSRE